MAGSHILIDCQPPPLEFLALENVSIRLADRITFAHTNWTWCSGEHWAMLGSAGAGKSLLIKALAGQVPLSAGEIRGPRGEPEEPDASPEEVISLVSPEAQRGVAIAESTFYQSRWHSGLQEGQRTVAQFLSQASVEGHNPFEVNSRHGNRRTFYLRRRRFVEWLGLEPIWRRPIAYLSNGELRKTLLVYAALRRPRLLVLEQPYEGLDIATRAQLASVIEQLMCERWAVLVSTERVDEIPRAATHLLWIHRHRVIAQGKKEEILSRWRSQLDGVSRGVTRLNSQPARPRRWLGVGIKNPLVELHKVTVVGAGKIILRDVTWILRAGESWVVLGPNGAGKSTLLNVIQGDHPQAYGCDVRLFGRSTDSTQGLWQARQQMGWMSPELHQHYPLEWTAFEVVASGFFNTMGIFQACSRRQRASAMRWLRLFNLVRVAHEPLGALSFEEQRLVLLARAAVKRPRLLILDEPCQGLDANQRVQVLIAVDRTVANTGSSLIFVTHHPAELPLCITHALQMGAGRILRADVFPSHPKLRSS